MTRAAEYVRERWGALWKWLETDGDLAWAYLALAAFVLVACEHYAHTVTGWRLAWDLWCLGCMAFFVHLGIRHRTRPAPNIQASVRELRMQPVNDGCVMLTAAGEGFTARWAITWYEADELACALEETAEAARVAHALDPASLTDARVSPLQPKVSVTP